MYCICADIDTRISVNLATFIIYTRAIWLCTSS